MIDSVTMFDHARTLMPGGVSSPVRSFGAVGGTPRFIRSARGCVLTDVEGRELVDLIGSWGAMIVGHAHPRVVEAITRTARDGTSFGACSPLESALAERIIDRVPSVERVRFVNSGTEAVMSALRVARAATARPLVVRFEGCYHGHADELLANAGSGVATLGLNGSAGAGSVPTILTARYNDLEQVRSIFAADGPRIAAVIVEPVAGNMGVVPPDEGFLRGLRAVADEHGSLLVFDEVITGFRVGRGGAQERYGVRPDLTTLGKIIGGGLPVGAYGGRADLMDLVAPAGPVYQAGTLSGNPLAMAAGVATLDLLDDACYDLLERRAAGFESALGAVLGDAAPIRRVGSMLSPGFGSDAEFAAFFHRMLERGVHLPPSRFESWFLSLAHDDAVLASVVSRAESAQPSGLAPPARS